MYVHVHILVDVASSMGCVYTIHEQNISLSGVVLCGLICMYMLYMHVHVF